MPINRQTIFISDLHLDQAHPQILQIFTTFLAQCDANIVDRIYILGDLFEAWIGDDDLTPTHLQVINALRDATQRGLKIYLMHGNRDFFLGKRFMRMTGCQLFTDDEIKINLYNEPVVIMHGDTLCTRDVAYLRARKLGHNRFLQFLFLLLPLSTRRKIAENMRKKSMRHTINVAKDIMDVTQEAVEMVMLKHKANFLIHGHTHLPAFHPFSLQNQQKERIVLGAWHHGGNKLVWHADGHKEWVEFE